MSRSVGQKGKRRCVEASCVFGGCLESVRGPGVRVRKSTQDAETRAPVPVTWQALSFLIVPVASGGPLRRVPWSGRGWEDREPGGLGHGWLPARVSVVKARMVVGGGSCECSEGGEQVGNQAEVQSAPTHCKGG